MIYPYKCAECGATWDVHQRLADYIASPHIPVCLKLHGKMQRVFTAPMIAPDYQTPFVSHIDGSVIGSRAQQKEHMARHGVVLYDDFAADLPSKRAAVVAEQFKDLKDDINLAIDMVTQGYTPEQKMVEGSVEDVEGIDVLETAALPEELKSDVLVEV